MTGALSPFLPILAAVALLGIFAIVLRAPANPKNRADRSDDLPYVARTAIVTPAERSFLGVLDGAVGDRYRIFAKVRLADVIDLRRGLESGERARAFNRIQSRHIDFVLCDPGTLGIVCAVELDDGSHKRADRRSRDEFIDAAMKAAGVPMVRIPVRSSYRTAEIADALAGAIR